MDTIQMKAMGKINLGLDVVGRLENGYHEVRMIMQTVQLFDKVNVKVRDDSRIIIHTNLPFLPDNENNIAWKAARLMMDTYKLDRGVSIDIEKHIPVAAGMAGGSTNAAAVLFGMNKLFGLGQTKNKLMELGVKLGADVPYCLMRGTALSEGIGEILTPLPPLPDCHILIAKPGISVSTKYVYEHLDTYGVEHHPDIDGMIKALEDGSLLGVAERMENVLETVTINKHPEIETIKQTMKDAGALNALMSGSGPTVFGIFNDYKKAEGARDRLRSGKTARQVYLTKAYNHWKRG